MDADDGGSEYGTRQLGAHDLWISIYPAARESYLRWKLEKDGKVVRAGGYRVTKNGTCFGV